MAPKAAPKALANILVHEDAIQRGKRYLEAKIVPRASKGELTLEDLSIPPHFLADPVLKPVAYFTKKKKTKTTEGEEEESEVLDEQHIEDIPPPSRLGHSASDSNLRAMVRKEVADVTKTLKAQVKNAEKRKFMFEKQTSKIQTKVDKRNVLLDKIRQMDQSMNDELRSCRRYAVDTHLFDPVYMYGSKFGTKAPRKQVLILAEKSEAMGQYVDEALDEMKKFLDQVIVNCSSFNIGVFDAAATLFSPTFVDPADPKKGLAAAMKWLPKNYTAKGMVELPRPNWNDMLGPIMETGCTPSAIYMACFNAPENTDAVLEFMEGKGVPIHCVCFDVEAETNDATMHAFFNAIGGEEGKMTIDTSQRDMKCVDQMMQSVKGKKKQLEKLLKQLEKMEDAEPSLVCSQELMEEQRCILEFVKNDLEVCEAALAGEDLPRDEEGNLILPPGTPVPP